jgi:hypothetical protein
MKRFITTASVAATIGMFSTAQAATLSDARHIAPAQEISIPNSYVRTVTSHKNGVTYRLSIFLPKGYDPVDAKRYPVFYFIRAMHLAFTSRRSPVSWHPAIFRR